MLILKKRKGLSIDLLSSLLKQKYVEIFEHVPEEPHTEEDAMIHAVPVGTVSNFWLKSY